MCLALLCEIFVCLHMGIQTDFANIINKIANQRLYIKTFGYDKFCFLPLLFCEL